MGGGLMACDFRERGKETGAGWDWKDREDVGKEGRVASERSPVREEVHSGNVGSVSARPVLGSDNAEGKEKRARTSDKALEQKRTYLDR
jgi:hypothetical protein